MESNQIHGHEVIDVVSQHPEGISVDRLAETVANLFGADARFFTCSAESMSLHELLSFLAERDKIQLRDDLVLPGSSAACDHD